MTEANSSSCPAPIDVQDFLFKQASIEQICEGFTNIPICSNLVAADAKRGLLYIGHEHKLIVVKPRTDSSSCSAEWKLELDLPGRACRVQTSCDCSFLAVTFSQPLALIYDLSSIGKHRLDVLHEIRLSSGTGDIFVSDLKWNPAIPEMLCSVTSDHTIGCFQVNNRDNQSHKVGIQIVGMDKIQGIEALCASWSPKGKQLVVGCKNGDIIQLKPELKPARQLPGPKPSQGVIVSILWVSNYQFCACYYLAEEQRVSVMIVDAPKGVPVPKFTNYEDVTYGTGSFDNLYYYFEHIPEWGLIIAASSHSTEVAVLGLNTAENNGGAGSSTWTIWQMVEGGAAQLPLNRKQGVENYPIGIAIDKSPSQRLPWTADSTLPNPVPILRILVTSGQLCSYHMVNLQTKAPDISSPPLEIILAPVPAPAAAAAGILPRPSIGPEVSFNLPSGATSTPRSSNPQKNSAVAAAANTGSSSNKTSEFRTEIKNIGFSVPPEIKTGGLFTPASVKTNLFQQPQQQQDKTPQKTLAPPPAQQPFAVRPDIKVTAAAAAAARSELQNINNDPAKGQQQQLLPPYRPAAAVATEPIARARELPEAVAVHDDALYLRAYFDEQYKFEKELQSKLDLAPNSTRQPLLLLIGSDEERDLLVRKTQEMDEFLRELKDTTNSLASDIAYLKALLLQSFAWLEESKSKNSTANLCGRARVAAESSTSKLADLQRLYYYTQSQLVRATQVLDVEWSEQRHKNGELARMKIPSMEAIYASLFRHSQIIAQEKKNIEDLSKKWRSLVRGGGSSSIVGLDRSMASLNLSQFTCTAACTNTTTTTTATTSIANATTSAASALVSDTAIDLRCKLIANNTLNFTREKQMKLRDLLAETAPMIVRAVRPSAVQDRLEATLSALVAQQKPPTEVTKTKTPRMPGAQQKAPDSSKSSKAHNPLSSLNNFVSGIGMPSSNKSPSAATPFSALTIAAAAATAKQHTPAKENMSISFSSFSSSSPQQQTASMMNKPIAKMNTISFGGSSSSSSSSSATAAQQQSTLEASSGRQSLLSMMNDDHGDKTANSNNNKFQMFPANTFGRLGSPEAALSAAGGGGGSGDISSMTSVYATVPKSTFSFSSTSAATTAAANLPSTPPQTFAAAKSPPMLADNTSVFKFSSGSSSSTTLASVAAPAPGSLDLSSLNFGNRSALTITPISMAATEPGTAAATAAAALPTFAFGKTSSSSSSAPQLQSSIFGQSATTTTTSKSTSTAVQSLEKSNAAATTAAATSAQAAANVTSTATPSLSAPSSSSSSVFGTSSLFGGLAAASPTFNFSGASTQAASTTSATLPSSAAGISFANLSSTAPSSTMPRFSGTLASATSAAFGGSTNNFGSSTPTPAVTVATTSTTSPSMASIFGKSSAGSIASPTASVNIFGGSSGTAVPSTTAATTTTSSPSLFGSISNSSSSTPATITSSSIFGSQQTAVSNTSTSSTTENSFFSVKPATAVAATSNIFGGSSQMISSSTPSTSSSSSAPNPNASIFGSSNSTPVFGASTTTTTSQTNNVLSSTTPRSAPIFRSSFATATAAAASSGGGAGTSTVFGGGNSTLAFGAATTTTTAAAAAASTTPSSGIFANVAAGGSIFGGGSGGSAVGTTAPTTGSIFGANPAAVVSMFGGGATTTTTASSTSIFGGSAAAVTTVGAAGAGGSIFGVAASPASTLPTGGIFGAAAAATNPTAAAGTSSIFGSPPSALTKTAGFGGATSAFGGAASPAGGAGMGAATAPVFGGAAFGGAPAFGGKPVFGSPSAAAASGFSFGSGFGSAPSFGGGSPAPAAGFGSAPIFGQQQQQPTTATNNTFEELGAQQGGLSFGSLATQQSTAAADAQKPSFAGSSSFSSWR